MVRAESSIDMTRAVKVDTKQTLAITLLDGRVCIFVKKRRRTKKHQLNFHWVEFENSLDL